MSSSRSPGSRESPCRRRKSSRAASESPSSQPDSAPARLQKAEALIAAVYLAGTNTRRVKRALFGLFEGAVSKDVVSRAWRKVKVDWDAWCARSLADEDIVRLILDGTVIRTASRAKKSAAGYDLTRLLVGSEGTLGIITEITLRLQGIPEAISAARCSFPSVRAACETVMQVIQYGIPVARIELLDALQVRACNAYAKLDLPETPLLLLEFHGSEAGVIEEAELFNAIAAEHGGSGYEATTSTEERNRLWKARHDAYWASLQLRPGAKGLSTDVCVPISRLADCVGQAQDKLVELGFVAPIVGHVGDGNFHTLILADSEDTAEIEKADAFVGWLNDLAISMDGTCTGEHGIGQGKMPYLLKELGPAVDAMVAIKKALDPRNILNPGKVVAV